jgi:hypothetical protein
MAENNNEVAMSGASGGEGTIGPGNPVLETSVVPVGQYAPDTRLTIEARSPVQKGAVGLTMREYHLLKILNSYGWCTTETVMCVANFHKVTWKKRYANQLLSNLTTMGFAVAMKIHDGTKACAYAINDRGLAYIRAWGDGFWCDTNTLKDPASMAHFLGINNIMTRFMKSEHVNFWLSDMQVRSDNSMLGRSSLAKDYDSVVELALSTGAIRIGVEYERIQKSSDRYLDTCSKLLSERYLHAVIYFLESPQLIVSIAPHFKKMGTAVCFVDYKQFMSLGLDADVKYWSGNDFCEAVLRDLLQHLATKQKSPYTPIHQIELQSD